MHAAARLAGALNLPPCFDYLEAVARLPAGETRPLSLRLHLPSFADAPDSTTALDDYLGRLVREAAMHAALLAGMCTVRQLSFDGAAPSGLSERQLDGILAQLHRLFRFMGGAASDHEAALRPAGLDGARLARLRGQGFSRLRIDLDGLDDPPDLRAQVAAARAADFRSVGVTLPYGVPGQAFALLRRQLDAVVAGTPDRVLLAHRPGDGRDEHDIPPGSVAQRMQQLAGDRLDMAAYTQTGPGAFARLPGDTGGAAGQERAWATAAGPSVFPGTFLLGCGVGAAGATASTTWRNTAVLGDYMALLDRYQLPIMAVSRRASV